MAKLHKWLLFSYHHTRSKLDVDALKGSKNQEADIKTALDGLKKTAATSSMMAVHLPPTPLVPVPAA